MAAMIDRDVRGRHVPAHESLFVGRKVSIRRPLSRYAIGLWVSRTRLVLP